MGTLSGSHRSGPKQGGVWLRGLLASNANADEDDTRTVRRALRRLGLFEAPEQGITGIPNGALFRGIEAFQKRQGLSLDGAMAPGGPTETRLNAALERQVADRSIPERARTAPAVGRASPTPRRSDLREVHDVGDKRLPEKTGAPIINMEADRRRAILRDERALFEIADNSQETGERPAVGELHYQGRKAVLENDHIITKEARRLGIDPDLVRAIVYVENARGWYDAINPKPGSVRPSNINPDDWEGLGGISRKNATNPEVNIRAGVVLIKRISERIKDPNPRKIASIWHFLGREQTRADENGYAARVDHVFRSKFWTKEFGRSAPPGTPIRGALKPRR